MLPCPPIKLLLVQKYVYQCRERVIDASEFINSRSKLVLVETLYHKSL